MKTVRVKFIGIDSWNRPIFKDIESRDYYGSTWNLFGYDAEEDVIKFYSDKKMLNTLCYFGHKFDCEPLGLFLSDMNIELELAE